MKGKISEIFDSVQGEGLYLGEKQVFVRFFGCNLSCSFCDTKLKYFFEYGPQELFEIIGAYSDQYHSLVFTGGEPLLQRDFLKEFMEFKKSRNGLAKNYLETNGTLVSELKDVIDYFDIVAMDFKLPSSSGNHKLWDEHRKFLEVASLKEVFIKSVICKDTSIEDLKSALELIKEINRTAVFVLQPNSFEDESALQEKLDKFKQLSLEENVTTCVIPQMHKIIGVK